ncbi:MAG: T9SS type A sorting domain-containing protein [Candidatus Cloacimonetes bacterium]|nr:T9SS type A sorting domain-containing protein [Candidatus Cloacimonadota bacterium]
MKSLDFKSIMIMAVLCTAILLPSFLNANCEMMGMIANKGNYISWLDSSPEDWDDPYDFFQFMIDESTPNPQNDGYGVIYYPDDGFMYFNEIDYFDEQNQAWYKTNRNNHGNWIDNSTWYGDPNLHWQWNDYEPLGVDKIIKNTIMNNNTKASIVLGHDRAGTGGHGNHPFRLQIETNGKHYTFEHNGYFTISEIKLKFYNRTNSLHQGWFYEEGHESNWDGEPGSVTDWIDSELYFHYILANIEEAGGDVIQGIYDALSYDLNPDPNIEDILIGSNERSNFILSDGFTVYAYRGTNITDYDLKYVENDTFWGITSGTASGTQLGRDYLAIFSPYGDVETINLFDPPIFVSGPISQNETWNSIRFITDDIIIPEGITLNIDAEVTFVSHCTFTVNGTVNLQDDSEFNINHSSEVLVENNGLLFLNWGSILTGCTPTTYGATPPGQPVGGEEVIPGDRIIAQNGGIITTNDDQNPGDVITIGSGLPEGEEQLWDGILIQNPDHDIDYWFVNCDISWINKLSIETRESLNVIANLKLYLTDFHDAGQILARNEHKLSISGENSANRCNIRNNHKTPIVVYDSPVNIDWALIEDNGRDINGGLLNLYCNGIYLSYSAVSESEIINTIIQGNTGCGIQTYSQYVNVENDTIRYNEQHGLFTKKGTFDDLHNTTILNNYYAEYVSVQDSYNWPDMDNYIADLDGNSGGNDQYILIAYYWDEIEHSIDVTGNYINHENNEHRFYPRYEAFRFDSANVPPEREMLYSALDEMRNENYADAETIFQQIISGYPDTNEAATSIRGLFFIENYTDKDYVSLRSYIDNIQVSEATYLYKAKEDVKTKSYMKEEDYVTAIERLEVIINNPPSNDELIYAMIDEGYCYLQLEEGGLRDIPAVCTVKPRSFDEYQRIVQELENELLFFSQPENNEQVVQANLIILHGNYPNPFNPSTNISFDISSESDVSITVYNVKGQKVTMLVDKHFENGSHTVTWNGKDSNNKSVSTGIYFYKISAGKETQVKKMLLLK